MMAWGYPEGRLKGKEKRGAIKHFSHIKLLEGRKMNKKTTVADL